MTVPLERRAARVLLLDAAGRILLQNCCDPWDRAQSWWNTPGGGVDGEETSAQAAARELAEETGLQVAAEDLGPVVHERVTEFAFGGQSYRQEEEYFLLRAEAFDAAPTAHTAVELDSVLGLRWWTRDELRRTHERVYPPELLEVLDRLAPLAAAPS
jgi:8-oxo-dGTP pyrophosphatase MutT (NUDIX family)